jgi:hypothetical protein
MSPLVPIGLTALAAGSLVLPLPRPRRWLLGIAKWLVYFALSLGVLTAALCALLPEEAPDALQPLADLASPGAGPLAWLVLAGALFTIALPLWTVLDFAHGLARHAAFLEKLAGALEPAGDAMAPGRRLPSTAWPADANGSELRDVMDALQRAANHPAPSHLHRAPLKSFLE